MGVEGAFAELTGQQATHKERERFCRLRDALSIVMTLEYYDSFWRACAAGFAGQAAKATERAPPSPPQHRRMPPRRSPPSRPKWPRQASRWRAVSPIGPWPRTPWPDGRQGDWLVRRRRLRGRHLGVRRAGGEVDLSRNRARPAALFFSKRRNRS
jgi:hypothetical protein